MNSECVLSNFKLAQISHGQRYDNIARFLMKSKGNYQQLINIAKGNNQIAFRRIPNTRSLTRTPGDVTMADISFFRKCITNWGWTRYAKR